MRKINIKIKKLKSIICLILLTSLITSCDTESNVERSNVTPQRNVTMIELNNGTKIPSIGLRSSNYELGIDKESDNKIDPIVVFSVETALKKRI